MKFKTLVLFAALLGLTACEKKEAAETQINLESEADRFSYALGMVIGERVLKQYGDVDYDLLLEGIKLQHKDQATLISLDEAGEVLKTQLEQTLATQTEDNKARGAEYLKSHAEKEGVQITESGLQYIVITEGFFKDIRGATEKLLYRCLHNKARRCFTHNQFTLS